MKKIFYLFTLCLLFFSCKKNVNITDDITDYTGSSKLQSGYQTPSDAESITSSELSSSRLDFTTTIGSQLFFEYYTIGSSTLCSYLSSTGASTIAVYNGLVIPNDYSVSNRVFIVTPIGGSYKTIGSAACLLNGTQIITPVLALQYINNYIAYPNKDPKRGVVLPISSMGYCTDINYNVRIYQGGSPLNRVALIGHIPLTVQMLPCPQQCDMIIPIQPKKFITKSVCPGNCDNIY